MVRIGLFGGVSAAADDGEPADVGSARTQAVLAALALAPGHAVPVPRLVDLVWADDPPRTAEKALQWHIARLRKGLGADAIVRVGAAYRLDVAPDAVDVARFRRRLDEGEVDAALEEWTGTPLAGLDAPGLDAAVSGLVEQWLGAVEAALEHRVEVDAPAAIGPLTELTARHPFRERLWALLMTALYRAGRQADALDAFRTARGLLVEQLGVEPGPQLRELESRILGHDERLRGAAASGLPRSPDRLIGRDIERERIAAMLAEAPIVTLVGPGGIGKTRLALEAARAGAGAARLAELAEIASSDDVPRAVADAIGATRHRGRTLTESVVAVLRSRPVLLVLDNCEHVIDGAARLAEAVAADCPDARVLATSRERLGVGGERTLAVGPLDPAGPGAELFTERATAADPAFDPRAHRRDVEDVCRRLDGIPLAIELAAARSGSLSPADLAARLDDRLRLLDRGRRTAAARHRTMRSAIEWSYDLLTEAERTLLQRLSVFAGPFDLAAAEAVAADAELGAVDEPLGGLVERSMLAAEAGPFGRRFRMLETVRQFAAAHLRASGRAAPLADRHSRWCLGRVARIHRLLTGPAEGEGVVRLGELWPDLRAAVDRACADGDAALAESLVRPVVTELPLRARHEIGEWAERIIALAPDAAFWRIWSAERHVQNGDPASFAPHGTDHPFGRYAAAYCAGDGEGLRRSLPEAAAELRRGGDEHLAAFIEAMSAGTLLGIGCFAAVDASVSALAERYRAQGPPSLLHWTLQTLGYSASFQGEHERAERCFEESIDVAVPAGTLSAGDLIRARVLFRRGERARAFATLKSYVDELFETDDMVAASVAAIDFINMTAAAGRLAEAATVLGYLESIRDFGALASRTLVGEAAERMAAASGRDLDREQASGRRFDDREVLAYMRSVLDGLAPSP